MTGAFMPLVTDRSPGAWSIAARLVIGFEILSGLLYVLRPVGRHPTARLWATSVGAALTLVIAVVGYLEDPFVVDPTTLLWSGNPKWALFVGAAMIAIAIKDRREAQHRTTTTGT